MIRGTTYGLIHNKTKFSFLKIVCLFPATLAENLLRQSQRILPFAVNNQLPISINDNSEVHDAVLRKMEEIDPALSSRKLTEWIIVIRRSIRFGQFTHLSSSSEVV